jgi:hypothetical protein
MACGFLIADLFDYFDYADDNLTKKNLCNHNNLQNL